MVLDLQVDSARLGCHSTSLARQPSGINQQCSPASERRADGPTEKCLRKKLGSQGGKNGYGIPSTKTYVDTMDNESEETLSQEIT